MLHGNYGLNARALTVDGLKLPALTLSAALIAASVGALAGSRPAIAVALVGGSLIMALAFVAPVAHLLLLVFVTAIVPFGIQNSFGFGGGVESPGLLLSDLLLAGGLLRGGLMLLNIPLDRRQRLVLTLILASLAVALLQFVQGYRAGHDVGAAGLELRNLLGLGCAFVAVPILLDGAARARLLKGLVALGLVLGLWGLAQWTLTIPFNGGDLGVREGIDGTTQGRGQLQGGLFGFPVAIVIAFAALLATGARSVAQRRVLVLLLALNGASLLLTYERTFWASTVAALLLVVLQAPRSQRMKAIVAAPASLLVLLAAFAIVAPAELTAARERLLSANGSAGANSLRYRKVESRHVVEKIKASPVLGSGLGATITWRPFTDVPFSTEVYSHNGFLWAAWKLGIPGLVLLLLTLAVAIVSRGRPRIGSSYGAVRTGAQAALVLLVVANLTFPTLNGLSITAVMGILIALCITPPVRAGWNRRGGSTREEARAGNTWHDPRRASGREVPAGFAEA